MANWRLAKSLEQLRSQVNTASPKRSKVSDGTIGDAAHASRSSDHNPWIKDSKGVGVVSAMDITHDPGDGVDGNILSRALIKDSRVKYVIFNSQIWKVRTGKWERYTGSNAHKQHVHVSVNPESLDDVRPWPWPVSVAPTPFTAAAANLGTSIPVSTFMSPQAAVIPEESTKEDTPAPDKPADIVEVQKEKPVPSDQPASTPGIKGSLVGVLTFITTSGSAIVAALGGWPTTIILGLFVVAGLIGLIWLVMRFWFANQDARRKAAEKEAEATRAHQITMAKIASARDKDSPTIEVTG